MQAKNCRNKVGLAEAWSRRPMGTKRPTEREGLAPWTKRPWKPSTLLPELQTIEALILELAFIKRKSKFFTAVSTPWSSGSERERRYPTAAAVLAMVLSLGFGASTSKGLRLSGAGRGAGSTQRCALARKQGENGESTRARIMPRAVSVPLILGVADLSNSAKNAIQASGRHAVPRGRALRPEHSGLRARQKPFLESASPGNALTRPVAGCPALSAATRGWGRPPTGRGWTRTAF